jgi:hypothetical protein
MPLCTEVGILPAHETTSLPERKKMHTSAAKRAANCALEKMPPPACRRGARRLFAPPPHAACRRRPQAEAAGDACGKWVVSPTLQPESPSKNL